MRQSVEDSRLAEKVIKAALQVGGMERLDNYILVEVSIMAQKSRAEPSRPEDAPGLVAVEGEWGKALRQEFPGLHDGLQGRVPFLLLQRGTIGVVTDLRFCSRLAHDRNDFGKRLLRTPEIARPHLELTQAIQQGRR